MSLTFIVYAVFIAVVATHSILEMLTTSVVILLDLGALVVWTSNINYVSDVLCRARRSRPLPKADPGYQPFVSLHIPAYNEPPDILIETIKAVERIDYPNFEVVVIDNNTKDPAVWGPVEEYCRGRERVRFVHVAPWPGYKAGACNLALRRYTDPRAEIIGLVDADDAAALAKPDAMGPLSGQPSHQRAAPRLPDGVGRVVPGPAHAGLQPAAARDHRSAGHGFRLCRLPDGRRPVAAAVVAHHHLTIFLSTAGFGGIDHVVDGTGRSSTAANPDAPVDVVSYP